MDERDAAGDIGEGAGQDGGRPEPLNMNWPTGQQSPICQQWQPGWVRTGRPTPPWDDDNEYERL